ncbi:MAG: pirin family protein [Bdellovibrionaceae bacterium]|nr:pirin family protein [Bdellovibrio sp.]
MVKIRKSLERGHADHGWLNARHSFSFGDYHDPQHMGFSALRVINEDRIAGGAGFPTHAHRDMEIITYIVDGVLEHKDSMGNTATISPGEVQRMSAGTGVRHSEYNHLTDKKTHLLQIWILPDKANYSPSYEQKNFSNELEQGELTLVASNEGRDGSVALNQDVDMYVVKSPKTGEKILNTDETRFYWIQVIKGTIKVNEHTLLEGDGLSASLLSRIHFQWTAGAEFIVFELP